MFKKHLLVLCVGLTMSVATAFAAVAKDFDIKLISTVDTVDFKFIEPLAPVEAIRIFASDYALTNIRVLDYGGDIEAITNSNQLVYNRSNVIVVKFAKVQNQNFERMRLAS